ncbi:adenine nucleotide alpha hydrolases-like superfamily protein [Actinidia rufa]|uniref:Adenine nucleotide alpha hydrolases-like superfamily protein n=1 Tax=Actinidia rufa TaxID=165716 RepID=A0A7J0EGQ4_9ERIC|nr:adenine nucleotide alpha hydrolases-like superfamily protein [Actinidia rufa]
MARARVRLPGFCVNHRGRVTTQPQQFTQSYNSIYRDDKAEFSNNSIEMNFSGEMLKPESESGLESGKRVMVVVESSVEAKGALQWALSHTVQSQDTVVLLHVAKPSKYGVNSSRQKAYELLCSMKDTCQVRMPGVHVEIVVVEGKEKQKGPTIVAEAKQQQVSLLVLGQRKQSMVWRLRAIWRGKQTRSRVVDYCIQNANCMTIAVRRKSRKYGGYLINTKRHKNFWLLA